MEQTIYKHIRDFSWILLIEAGAKKLPLDIRCFSNLYDVRYTPNYTVSRYVNFQAVSNLLLNVYGYPSGVEESSCLAIHLMSPLIVLKDCHVKNAVDIVEMTDIPYNLALERYHRLLYVLKTNRFNTSKFESAVQKQFAEFVKFELSYRAN